MTHEHRTQISLFGIKIRDPMETDDPLVQHCRSLPGSSGDVRWGNDLIFSVGGKMFAGFELPDLQPLAFMVDPTVFDEIISSAAFQPAPYMARHHWVMVANRRLVPQGRLKELLTESHRLVVAKLSPKAREALGLQS